MRLKVNTLEVLLLLFFTTFFFYVIKEVTVNTNIYIFQEFPIDPNIYDFIKNFDFYSLKLLGYNYIFLKIIGNYSILKLDREGICCSLLIFPKCVNLNLTTFFLKNYSIYGSISIRVYLNESAFRNYTYKLQIPLSYFNGCSKSFIIFDEFGNLIRFRYYFDENNLNLIFKPDRNINIIYISCLNLTLKENLVDQSITWNKHISFSNISYINLNIFTICYNCTSYFYFSFVCNSSKPFYSNLNYSENFSYYYVSLRPFWFNPISGEYFYLSKKIISGKCIYFNFIDEKGIKYIGELC